jgi:hypothetical protein
MLETLTRNDSFSSALTIGVKLRVRYPCPIEYMVMGRLKESLVLHFVGHISVSGIIRGAAFHGPCDPPRRGGKRNLQPSVLQREAELPGLVPLLGTGDIGVI